MANRQGDVDLRFAHVSAPPPLTLWLSLAWPGLTWRGLAWLGLAWLGLAWLCSALLCSECQTTVTKFVLCAVAMWWHLFDRSFDALTTGVAEEIVVWVVTPCGITSPPDNSVEHAAYIVRVTELRSGDC